MERLQRCEGIIASLEKMHSILTGLMKPNTCSELDLLLSIHPKQHGIGSDSSLWQLDLC